MGFKSIPTHHVRGSSTSQAGSRSSERRWYRQAFDKTNEVVHPIMGVCSTLTLGSGLKQIVQSTDNPNLSVYAVFPTIIRLIVFLDLQRTPNGYVISRQEDHIIWTESIQRSFPVLHHVWYTYVTRWTGLAIVYIMRVSLFLLGALWPHEFVPLLW